MTTPQPAPTSLQRWILASRPKTLPAAASPVLVGSGVAASLGSFWLPGALAALAVALLIQIATNLVNDVVDFQRGTDDEARLGPLRVTQAGLLTPRQVWSGVALAFGLAALAGLFLAWHAGWPVIALGAACILAGILYTAGPYPLAYHGLGDLFALLFFGFAGVCGTVYVQAGRVPLQAWLGGLGVGCLVTAILIVNNIRDLHTDRLAGRSNIPIRFGRRAGEIEYALMLVTAFLVPPAVALWAGEGAWAVLPCLALPLAARRFRTLLRLQEGPAFNRFLAQTAQLCLAYSLLLAVGIAL